MAIHNGKILVGKRDDGKGYCIPGGHIKPGESFKKGAQREFREETGCVPAKQTKEQIKRVHTNLKDDGSKYVTFVCYFDSEINDFEPVEEKHDEHEEFLWLEPDELKEKDLHDEFESTIEDINIETYAKHSSDREDIEEAFDVCVKERTVSSVISEAEQGYNKKEKKYYYFFNDDEFNKINDFLNEEPYNLGDLASLENVTRLETPGMTTQKDFDSYEEWEEDLKNNNEVEEYLTQYIFDGDKDWAISISSDKSNKLTDIFQMLTSILSERIDFEEQTDVKSFIDQYIDTHFWKNTDMKRYDNGHKKLFLFLAFYISSESKDEYKMNYMYAYKNASEVVDAYIEEDDLDIKEEFGFNHSLNEKIEDILELHEEFAGELSLGILIDEMEQYLSNLSFKTIYDKDFFEKAFNPSTIKIIYLNSLIMRGDEYDKLGEMFEVNFASLIESIMSKIGFQDIEEEYTALYSVLSADSLSDRLNLPEFTVLKIYSSQYSNSKKLDKLKETLRRIETFRDDFLIERDDIENVRNIVETMRVQDRKEMLGESKDNNNELMLESVRISNFDKFCTIVADAYEACENKDETKSAYESLKKDIEKQFSNLTDKVRIKFVGKEAYTSAEDMRKRINDTGIMVMNRKRADDSHEMLSSKEQLKLKCIHDYLAHYKQEKPFGNVRRRIASYHTLNRLFSPESKKALFTEIVAKPCCNMKYRKEPRKCCILSGFSFDNFGVVDEMEYQKNFQ